MFPRTCIERSVHFSILFTTKWVTAQRKRGTHDHDDGKQKVTAKRGHRCGHQRGRGQGMQGRGSLL